MQTWRVLGALAVGSGGLLMVLVAMAQARDGSWRLRTDDRPSVTIRVARSAAIGLVLLAAVLVLVLTVLPAYLVWGVAVASWLILMALFLAG